MDAHPAVALGPRLGRVFLELAQEQQADRIGISGPWLYSGSDHASKSASSPSMKKTPAATRGDRPARTGPSRTSPTRAGTSLATGQPFDQVSARSCTRLNKLKKCGPLITNRTRLR